MIQPSEKPQCRPNQSVSSFYEKKTPAPTGWRFRRAGLASWHALLGCSFRQGGQPCSAQSARQQPIHSCATTVGGRAPFGYGVGDRVSGSLRGICASGATRHLASIAGNDASGAGAAASCDSISEPRALPHERAHDAGWRSDPRRSSLLNVKELLSPSSVSGRKCLHSNLLGAT